MTDTTASLPLATPRAPSRLLDKVTAASLFLLICTVGIYLGGFTPLFQFASDRYYVCISSRQSTGVGFYAGYHPTGWPLAYTPEARSQSSWPADFVYSGTPTGEWEFCLVVSWLLLLLLPVPLAFLRVANWWRNRKPIKADGTVPCPQCGYDLRSGHERCPECGAETSVVVKTDSRPAATAADYLWITLAAAEYVVAILAGRARPAYNVPWGPEWAWHNLLAEIAIVGGCIMTAMVAVVATRRQQNWSRLAIVAAITSAILPVFALFAQ